MDHAFGDGFVVELGHFLPKVEILHEGRPLLIDFE